MAEKAAETRRSELERRIRAAQGPLSGAQLAEALGVSRQVIVQDIAVLRARGIDIQPTPRGYVLGRNGEAPAGLRTLVAVRHTPEETAQELFAITESGVAVLDVVVEHPLYGELRGTLCLRTPDDVRTWLEELTRERASLLSSLTGGVHLHTLEAPTPAALALARRRLRDLGFLLV